MSMNSQQILSMPQQSAPSVVTSGDTTQALMLQAMLANMKPEQAAQLQAALQMQARRAANSYYMKAAQRKLAPALTNGTTTQAYQLATPLTFNLTTAINGFCEGIILRVNLNYTLGAGTSAAYAKTAAGLLGIVDSIDVRYNKSQHHIAPRVFRHLAMEGALEDYILPEAVTQSGQSQAGLQSYLTTDLAVAVGAQSAVLEMFIPFCLLGMDSPLGLLPIIVGDTGIQVTVNLPQSLLGSDPTLALYPLSGSGHAVTGVSGTVQIDAVYRDGDVWMGRDKIPFDMSAVGGTFQMQIDQVLQPLIAGSQQRTKLTVMGKHAYVLLEVIDGLQSNLYASNSNITYLEMAKDGVGANVFQKYGTQTNLSVNDYFYMKRLHFKQDLDQGIVPLIHGPVMYQGDPHIRNGIEYLDNTPDGWPDFRYCVTLNSVGNGTLNSFPCTPRIIPHVFYTNPVGLVPV